MDSRADAVKTGRCLLAPPSDRDTYLEGEDVEDLAHPNLLVDLYVFLIPYMFIILMI